MIIQVNKSLLQKRLIGTGLLGLLVALTAASIPLNAGRAADAIPAIGELPSLPAGSVWKQIDEVSDEFNGNQLDTTKWASYYPPGWRGRPPSNFLSDNVILSGGDLILRSTSKVQSLDAVKNPKTDIWINSACIASRKPICLYGFYEARIKASKLSMASSFWLQGKSTEIDVVEQLGKPILRPEMGTQMLMNTHLFTNGFKNDAKTPTVWQMPGGSADDYHVYGVWWKDEKEVWFYHNGVKVAAVQTPGEFREPMYLILDTEAFSLIGLPTLESLKDPEKNGMMVDWVRSWRVEPGTAPKP